MQGCHKSEFSVFKECKEVSDGAEWGEERRTVRDKIRNVRL